MNNKIYVWDPLIRIFHWTLVAAFTFSYFSGEEETIWHIYSGYTILGLLVFRLVWGLIGSQYARFSSFVFAPSKVFAYLGSLFSKKDTENYVGHNPAGSWMVIALLLSLSITVFSGLKHYGEEGHGPLAEAKIGLVQMDSMAQIATADEHEAAEHEAQEHEESENDAQMRSIPASAHDAEEHDEEGDEEDEELWEEVHEVFANLTLLLVLLHILGVILSSRKHGENLARAMVTGYKQK